MKKGTAFKKGGTAIMILGLVFMVAAFVLTDELNYVLIGLVITSIGSLMVPYGKKQQKEK